MSRADITAVCVDTLHHRMALLACERMARLGFRETVLFTDGSIERFLPAAVWRRGAFRIEHIEPIATIAAYSEFILRELPSRTDSPHVLVFQWDGFATDPGRWWDGFLEYDYVGAPWADVHIATPGRRVGNGGFSLRSRRLLEAAAHIDRPAAMGEDTAICALHGERLERERGIRFAPVEVARHFSVEHTSYEAPLACVPAFGFHGWFNFHLHFGDAEILEMLKNHMEPAERLALLGSWSTQRLLCNLHAQGRASCFEAIVALYVQASGRRELLNLQPQAQIDALARKATFQ